MKANKIVLWFWDSVVRGMDEKRFKTLPNVEDVEEIVNIKYLNDNHPLHTLNIYKPKGNNDMLPVIFDIHGGGWYYGDKELNSWYCKSLVRHGFAVVDISYRLSPEVDIFGQMQDIFKAMEFVSKNGKEYNLDLDKLFVTGDSAGGHIVGLIANIVKDEKLQEKYGVKPSIDVKGICPVCPALEPLALLPRLAKVYFNPVFGKGYMKNGVKDIVSFKSTFRKDICPMFFISAYGDPFKGQAQRGYDLCVANGVKAGIYMGEKDPKSPNKLGHVFNISFWHWAESLDANKQMCDFFKEIIK